MLVFLKARFCEPSTYAGLAAFSAGAAVKLPDPYQTILLAAAAGFGAVAVFLHEKSPPSA